MAKPPPVVVRVLHLDDDALLLMGLATSLRALAGDFPTAVESFERAAAFREALAVKKPDVALIDMNLAPGDGDGATVIEQVRKAVPRALVLAVSGNLETTRRAIKAGADDFVSKLSTPDEIAVRIANLYRMKAASSAPPPSAEGVAIGASMTAVASRIPALLASAVSAVHVKGESGTGKEVVATLFERALGGAGPFVKVNCGAISENLIERELFGHVKGAFTGAAGDAVGYFEAASGGWIFLDEVATLTPAAQTALLRVIENQEVVRVGDHKARKIDVRIVSACNESLEALAAQGKFRRDLWQRLREAVIELPPLRARLGEARELLRHFAATERGGPYRLLPETEAVLMSYDWAKGNIRELRNCVRAMTEKHVEKSLSPMSIPVWIWDAVDPDPAPAAAPAVMAGILQLAYDGKTSFDAQSDLLLLEMIATVRQAMPTLSLQRAAAALGMPKSTLATKLRRISEHDAALDGRIKDLFRSAPHDEG